MPSMLYKEQDFSFRVRVYLLFSFLLQETLKYVFLPPYDHIKLKNDTNYMTTSEDTVEDLLMNVQFFIKSKVFPFRVTFYLLFSFLLKETLKSAFLPPYDYLKLKNDTN